MKPRTPPICSIVAISPPITSVKMSTRVSPASEKTLMTPSSARGKARKGSSECNRQNPAQMPIPREMTTCRVAMASRIASTGGRIDNAFGS